MIEKTINGIMFNASAWPPDSGKPTIIFLHGAGNTKSLWREQVDALQTWANTMALDLPGHGGSPGPGRSTINEYASAVEEFITAANPPRPVICGLSMGGAIAIQMMINNRVPWKGGMLLNTGARLKVHPLIFDSIKNDYGKFIALTKSQALSPETPYESAAHVIDDMAACDHDTIFGDFTACNEFNASESLNLIKVPVLIITSADDRLTPEKYGIFLKENISGSKRIHIPACGHLSPAEKPAEVNSAIKDFLGSFID